MYGIIFLNQGEFCDLIASGDWNEMQTKLDLYKSIISDDVQILKVEDPDILSELRSDTIKLTSYVMEAVKATV